MKSLQFSIIGLLVLVAVILWPSANVRADCADPDGIGNGADYITCDDDPASDSDGVSGQGDDDTITVPSGNSVTGGNLDGQTGNDTITVDGSTAGSVNGGPGDDTISVNGSVDGSVTGGPNNDTITVGGSVGDNVGGNAGDDTIIIVAGGSVDGSIGSGDGNDTVTVDGTVDGSVVSDAGSDTITVNGVVGDFVSGGADSDTMTINGGMGTTTPTGVEVMGGAGDDTVTLQDGANSGSTLELDGGDGTDTLVFELSTTDPSEMAVAAAIIALQNPSGSLTFSGQIYQWESFESLVSLLTLIVDESGGPVEVRVINSNGVPATPNNRRCFDDMVNLVVYCNPDGSVEFYRLTGPGGDGLPRGYLSYAEWAFAAPGSVILDTVDEQGYRLVFFVDEAGNYMVQLFTQDPGDLRSAILPLVNGILPLTR